MIVVGEEGQDAVFATEPREDTVVVGTPLDLIVQLGDEQHLVSRVVFAGHPSSQRELAAFLRDDYPSIVVVDDDDDDATLDLHVAPQL